MIPSQPPTSLPLTAESAMNRPPVDPATGVRRVKLRPHETTDPLTATGDLFVLAHLGVRCVDPVRWSLVIDGLVGRARTLGLDDLKGRPKKVVEAVHQCCGSPLEPRVATRRVANVRWGGADLAALLDEVEIDARARFLWSYGLDGGEFAGSSCDWFVKDLPLARLAAGEVLLAYELNGEPLPLEHGFRCASSCRASTGRTASSGYGGCTSRRIGPTGRSRPCSTTTLAAEDIAAGLPPRQPVWAQAPEAIIVAPALDAGVAAGKPTEIWGWTWSFRGIAAAEVSRASRAALPPARPGLGGASPSVAALGARRGAARPRPRAAAGAPPPPAPPAPCRAASCASSPISFLAVFSRSTGLLVSRSSTTLWSGRTFIWPCSRRSAGPAARAGRTCSRGRPARCPWGRRRAWRRWPCGRAA